MSCHPAPPARLPGDSSASLSPPNTSLTTSPLASLPALVWLKILRLLSPEFSAVQQLGRTCRQVRARVQDCLPLLYHTHLHLSSGALAPAPVTSKPVLSLKLTCAAGPGGEAERARSQARLLQTVGGLDLSCLKSLELRQEASRAAFRGIRNVLTLNPSLAARKSLDCLKLDVNLINLSEIRDSIINIVYQHDDFATGGPITNIDYIVNSAVSQVLYPLLQFTDSLFSGPDPDTCQPASRLKRLEVRFLPEPDCDWAGPELDRENLNRTEAGKLRDCLQFMIKEFQSRLQLHCNHTERITVTGIPTVFQADTLEFCRAALEEATAAWPGPSAWRLTHTSLEDTFNLTIDF